MKLLAIVITFAVSFITFSNGQGWQSNPFFGGQSPPGVQFNPYFSGQSPPGAQFNPYFSGQIPPASQFNPNFGGLSPPGAQYNPYFGGQNLPGSQFNPHFGGQSPPGLQFNPYFGGQKPSGLQFNPIFNGQNTNPNIPANNITNYHPFISNFPQKNNSNPLFNFWSNVPFFSYFSSGHRLTKRAVGSPQFSPYYCIPDHHQCNGSHSVSIGCLSPWDRALFRQSYVKPGKFFWKREKIINYPGDFLPPGIVRNETITAIKIQDRNCNGTGGYAQVMPGTGVGYRRATIKMYSTGARKGFNFYVQIFGQ